MVVMIVPDGGSNKWSIWNLINFLFPSLGQHFHLDVCFSCKFSSHFFSYSLRHNSLRCMHPYVVVDGTSAFERCFLSEDLKILLSQMRQTYKRKKNMCRHIESSVALKRKLMHVSSISNRFTIPDPNAVHQNTQANTKHNVSLLCDGNIVLSINDLSFFGHSVESWARI